MFKMDELNKLKEFGESLGLKGDKLASFIKEQQDKARDDREVARQERAEKLATDQKEKDREHELRVMELRSQNPNLIDANENSVHEEGNFNDLKLPLLTDSDDIVPFLIRFERLSNILKLSDECKALKLGTLLRGKALNVYASLPVEFTTNYSRLKAALLLAFQRNYDSYRKEFRYAKISANESYVQFAAQLGRLLDYWIESKIVEKSYDNLREFILMDQFLQSCNSEIRVFVKEHQCDSIIQMAEYADTFAIARNVYPKTGSQGHRIKPKSNSTAPGKNQPIKRDMSKVTCYACGQTGHVRARCPQSAASKHTYEHKVSYALDDSRFRDNMTSGTVNGMRVSSILRDTGASCIIISDELLPEYDLTKCKFITLNDYLGRADKFPVVKCYLDCKYFSGWVDAVRAPIRMCAVLVGNVEGLNPNFKVDNLIDLEYSSSYKEKKSISQEEQSSPSPIAAVETRASKLRSVHPLVNVNFEPLKITHEEFVKLQQSCETLKPIRDKLELSSLISNRSGVKYKFELINSIIFRICVGSKISEDIGKTVLVVPLKCRQYVLKLAHDSPVAGHFSHRKTQMKVFENFYWPGAVDDIVRYCKSCDTCQRVSAKGRVKPVPLQKMPVITVPFERIAIDLMGPFSPPSAEGHRYVLTIIDYATRYPEAIPLKTIDSITIAEALITVFARVGIPKEILSDRGKQFTSDLMGEIHKLLSVKPLFSSPYHAACNGLVEKMNGIIKSIIKKLCNEQPTNWHRFIPAALFAIREIPNDTLKFSPFELLYGRRVRGPLSILRELWENPKIEESTRTTYQYVFDIRNRLEDTAILAADMAKVGMNAYKAYYDLKTQNRKFEPNDEVLILLPTENNKLLSQWKGPFKVVAKINAVDYKINVNGKCKIFHANMLKMYHRRAVVNRLYVADEQSCLTNLENSHRLEVVQASVVVDDKNDEGKLITLPVEEPVKINPELTVDQKNDVAQLLVEYSDVISDKPGCTDTVVHKINIKTTEPVRKKPYPIPINLKDHFDAEIEKMLEYGVIEPSNSPYSNPVVMVRKQTKPDEPDKYRVCLDFRLLNSVCEFDAEPMPQVDQNLHKFVGSNFISEIDLCKAYFQIPLEPESKKYTAFPTSKGLMQFTSMPFGLSTSGSSYVRLMNRVFEGAKNVSVYFDNVYVYTKTWADHLQVLRETFDRLRKHGLTAGPAKCYIGYSEVEHLGFSLGKDYIRPIESKINAIQEMKIPITKTQLRSFMGTMSFYRKFIRDFAAIAVPLTDMLKRRASEKLNWDEQSIDSFNKLRLSLVTRPILNLPDNSKTFCLRTDASSVGIGAVLFQYTDDIPMPVAYASKKLLSRERNYAVIERECLAIVWGVEKFKMYLYGKLFVIETDHQPLAHLKKAKLENSRLMRWALILQEYKFRVVYISGKDNYCADMLSRC